MASDEIIRRFDKSTAELNGYVEKLTEVRDGIKGEVRELDKRTPTHDDVIYVAVRSMLPNLNNLELIFSFTPENGKLITVTNPEVLNTIIWEEFPKKTVEDKIWRHIAEATRIRIQVGDKVFSPSKQ